MIREANKQDAVAIADIYNYYVDNTSITFEEERLSAADINERIDSVQGSGFSWLVALENDIIVGFAYSKKWKERSAYRNTVEVSVYLQHRLTSKGWGTSLYQELFSGLKKLSLHVAVAGITLPNAGSIALHEKFAMEKVAHFKQVGYKLGE